MKTRHHITIAFLYSLLPLSLLAAPTLPLGQFRVVFSNGVVEDCEFRADLSAQAVEQGLRNSGGTMALEKGAAEVRYLDRRVERWTLEHDQWKVIHWASLEDFDAAKPPVAGVAMKLVPQAPAEPEPKSVGKLKVHEWGTFTVLQGSDGQMIEWYQPAQSLADLPAFVQNTQFGFGFGKTGTPQAFWRGRYVGWDTVRMETPVLYFYPEKEMEVKVVAQFAEGRITEAFPPAQVNSFGEATWRGRLLPPDAALKAKIPAAEGSTGRHYAAARAVPSAWLYQNLQAIPVLNPATGKDVKVEPVDHFIFYRGAGHPISLSFGLVAGYTESPDRFVLSNYMPAAVPHLFALQVAAGKASFTEVKNLERTGYDATTKKPTNQETISIPAPQGAVLEVAKQLSKAMEDVLVKEGLTQPEAAAMVATWDNLWFTEPGTRLLAILPQEVPDAMVPLRISPQPTEIERVFVARVELFSKAQESSLMNMLMNPPRNAKDAKPELVALQLGRFQSGAFERAATLANQQMLRTLFEINAP